MGILSATNRLLVFARHDLVGPGLSGGDPAILLEGSWPAGTSSPLRWSLDDEIDARFARIDEEASRLAERLAEPLFPTEHDDTPCHSINPAWLNALGLRYYLVKLIRLVAYFTEVRPLRAEQGLELVVAARRDEDYVDCVGELCRLAAAHCRVQRIDRPRRPVQLFPPNGCWRRAVARFASLLELHRTSARPRVVLCGNPRLLDPICRELVKRGASVWWLYDRFALRSWLRWSAFRVGQLVCDSSEARENGLVLVAPGRLECRGVDLAGAVSRWLAGRLRTHGPRQTRILEQIDAHFRRVRPDAVVLDEDATPMARAAVALARLHRARSFVVQHGAPACRFGFAPPAADRTLVWGRSSEVQLARWGVPPQRIHVVGSPRHETLYRALSRGTNIISRQRTMRSSQDRPPRILLLATVPPRDERPDAVTLHLTRRTYAGMIDMALAVVGTVPRARVIVKLHPRAPDDPVARGVLARFPWVNSRVVSRGPLEKRLRWTDCVLSCVSSAGVDATLAGVPVIQLLPPGSGDVLPAEQWGMLGSARSKAELQRLLAQALSRRAPTTKNVDVRWVDDVRSVEDIGWVERSEPDHDADPNVFAHLDGRAASRIAELVVGSSSDSGPSAEPACDVERTDRRARSDPIHRVRGRPDRMSAVTTNG